MFDTWMYGNDDVLLQWRQLRQHWWL